jgi:hypothetical protein
VQVADASVLFNLGEAVFRATLAAYLASALGINATQVRV